MNGQHLKSEDLRLEDYIDRAIKETWKNEIKEDITHDFILHEDTLKSALYHHLRRKLGPVLEDKNVRIFTEFNSGPLAGKGVRADMAIVQLAEHQEGHLKYWISKVYALIELKYAGEYSPVEVLGNDVSKVLGLMKGKALEDCQFYLGFIHEGEFDSQEKSWLYKWQQNRAAGKLTELSACYYTNRDDMWFTVVSYNGMNEDLSDTF